MKKVFILFLSLTLLLFSIVPAFAAGRYYSSLPEPVPFLSDSGLSRFYFIAERSNGVVYLYEIQALRETNISFTRNSSGVFSLNLTNLSSSLSFDYKIVRYNALNGSFVSVWSGTLNSLSSKSFSLESYVSLSTFGFPNYSGADNVPLTQISWSDSLDPNTYVSWLQNIYTRQGNILQDLEIFYNAFDTFRQVNHSDLTQIYSILSDIYDLLSEDSELSTAPVDDFSNAVEEYNSVEDQLMLDYQSDVDLQFQKSDQVFTGNNAFALISSTFTDLFVNGNIKINALILFTLCLGLGVLLIGRKLNA